LKIATDAGRKGDLKTSHLLITILNLGKRENGKGGGGRGYHQYREKERRYSKKTSLCEGVGKEKSRKRILPNLRRVRKMAMGVLE